MGVNMAGYAITDDEACREAARQEIVRRYFKALVDERRDGLDDTISSRVAIVMSKAGCTVDDRRVVASALSVEAVSYTHLAWSGILNAHTGELDLPILEHIGVDPALFLSLIHI